MPFENNYTLGRGEVYFDPFIPGTQTPSKSERYLGNTPEFNITFDSENLDHFSSDRGIREKDRSVILQINRTGSLITDNVSPANLALFFFGSLSALSVAAVSVSAEQVGVTGTGVQKGMFYQLGQDATRPTGHRGIIFPGAGPTAFALTTGATPLVAGVDFVLNPALGRIELLDTGTVVTNGSVLTANYSVAASTRTRVISGSAPIKGALRYIAYNPEGQDFDYYMPSVSLSPNGDYALKAEEWQQIPFNVEILKPAGGESVYIDGRPLVV